MEDYSGAYQARRKDTNLLLNSYDDHNIAAFHFGGIAIECKLKALLLTYHKINNWGEPSCRARDSMYNQNIENPGHSLLSAIRRMPAVYKKAKTDPAFIKHLSHIICPLGANSIDYINIRYLPEKTPPKENWQQSFNYVCGWLAKNQGTAL